MSALLALLKAKQQDIQAGKTGKTQKVPDGTSRWRLAPSWRGGNGEQPFWHDYGQHFVKNAANEMMAVYICTEKTFGQPCAVCEAIAQGMKGATDDATMELLKEAKAPNRILVNACQVDGKTPTVFAETEIAPTVFDQIIAISVEWAEAGESIFDKELLITRTGTGKQTKYVTQVAAMPKMTVTKDMLAKLPDLDTYVRQESSERQTRALNSVRSVAGLLSAPGGANAVAARPSGLPLAAAAGASIVSEPEQPAQDDNAVAAPPPKRARPADEAAVDVVAREVASTPAPAPAPVAAPAPAPVAAAPASAGSGDADLDKMLADLGM